MRADTPNRFHLMEARLGFERVSGLKVPRGRLPQFQLHVIAQHELLRAGIKVNLRLQILDRIFSDVVANQRDRHDKRRQVAAEITDHLYQLLPLAL